MAETRWQVVDPQNRIRRLPEVADGTVTVEIVLPTDDPVAVAAVEQSAIDTGISLVQVPLGGPPSPSPIPGPDQVIVNGITYVPLAPPPVLPS